MSFKGLVFLKDEGRNSGHYVPLPYQCPNVYGVREKAAINVRGA